MSEHVRFDIKVLGSFRVEADGLPVIERSWSRRKAQAILKLLAIQPAHALHRDEVLDQLWPEMEPSAAQNNLHKNLHHIRSALAQKGVTEPLVALNGEMLALADSVRVDADEFRETSRRALQEGYPQLLQTASDLYSGGLLPEDAYEEWTGIAREDIRTRYSEVMHQLARAHDAAGEHPQCIQTLQSLLQADPLHEEAHRLLMRQFAHVGSRHRALRQYQALVELLRDELGTTPSDETTELYESLAANEPESREPSEHIRMPFEAPAGHHRRTGRRSETFGREDELEVAQDLIDAAMTGSGRAMIIWGEAGIGKSHFATQVMADGEELGCLTVTSRCSELESSSAYQPFRDLFHLLAGSEDALLRNSPYLGRIVYGTLNRGELPQDSNLFHTELFNEAFRFIQQRSHDHPLIICLEDFHDADADSVRLFHFLARRVRDLPVLLIATARRESRPGSQLPQLTASLRREEQVTEVELEPLGEQATALLIESLFGETRPHAALLREILALAEGNPLFATEMVHTLIQEGWARVIDGQWARRGSPQPIVPSAVKEFLDIRLARLTAEAQALIQCAAVHGRTIDYSLLRETLTLPEGDALDALDQCIEARIIEETGAGYQFRHDLLREGVYERLTRARRQRLHKLVASALAGRSTEPLGNPLAPEISHHYALSDEPRLAIPYLIEAAQRAAAVFANEQAAGFYEQALTLLDQYPVEIDQPAQARIVEATGDIQRRMGENQLSVRYFERAQAMYAALGDFEASARARGKAALGHIMSGRPETARDQVALTLNDLNEASPQHIVSRTYYLLAQLHWHSGDNREALEAAERALVAAEDSDDLADKAQAFEVMALACHSLGDWKRGVELELERQTLGVPGFNTDEAFEAHL